VETPSGPMLRERVTLVRDVHECASKCALHSFRDGGLECPKGLLRRRCCGSFLHATEFAEAIDFIRVL